jgi:hypothetical protein
MDEIFVIYSTVELRINGYNYKRTSNVHNGILHVLWMYYDTRLCEFMNCTEETSIDLERRYKKRFSIKYDAV